MVSPSLSASQAARTFSSTTWGSRESRIRFRVPFSDRVLESTHPTFMVATSRMSATASATAATVASRTSAA